jgi:hypothetical protein
MQLFTARRLSISARLVVSPRIDSPKDFSRLFNRLKNIFEKEKLENYSQSIKN